MSWQSIRGHEALIRSLREVARTGRLGHAYLFVGLSGVGKRRVAVELAKALHCESPPEPIAACDKCPACSQVMAETHPDLIRASRPEERNEFVVEVIEGVIESLALKPARGKYKIAIIDDADDFNASSANKFLKTLEEPPPRTLLILLATDLERQLPTIRSRCQVVRFAPLPAAVIADLLRETGVEAERAEPLSRLGGGSIGRALDLADESLWEFRRGMVATLGQARMDAVGFSKRWLEFVEEAGKESGHQRRRAALVIRLIVDLLEAALRVSHGDEGAILDPADLPTVRSLATRFSPERLLKLIDRCLTADYHNDRRMQLVLMLESLVDALAASPVEKV